MTLIVTTAQIDKHYRIVIHRQHRNNLDWETGNEVQLRSDGNQLIIERVNKLGSSDISIKETAIQA